MQKVWNLIQRITYALAGFTMLAVIVLIFVNVLCRYFFLYSIPWCEEVTRYMFIATIFLTLNIMVSQRAELRVDLLDNFLKGKAKLIVSFIVYLIVLITLGIMTYSGIMLTAAGKISVSPSLHLPMYIVYGLIPLGYGLTIISVMINMVNDWKEYKKGEQS